jgi:hypothetical protein
MVAGGSEEFRMPANPTDATPKGVSRCQLPCNSHGAFLFVDSGCVNVAAPGQPMHFMSTPESHDSSADLDRAVGGRSLSSRKMGGGDGEGEPGCWSCAPATWARTTGEVATTIANAVQARTSRWIAEARMALVKLATSRLDDSGRNVAFGAGNRMQSLRGDAIDGYQPLPHPASTKPKIRHGPFARILVV